MEVIRDRFFEGERPLYASHDLRLERVKIYPGESALKESSGIEAYECEFMGKYPFWHNENALIEKCLFTVYARAAIWYSSNICMTDTLVEAPKMFREIRGLSVKNSKFTSAGETIWNCRDIEIENVEVRGGDYIFMNCSDIKIDGFRLQGNYSFQDARNVEIRNAHLDSKDAFWNTENVTVYDSELNGEYLGWYSKKLRLVNCTISGTQPLCYATDLVMENCRMTATDLCFENTTLEADIDGHIVSVKNPKGGCIKAGSIGETLIDAHCKGPGDCVIEIRNK